MSNDNKVKGLLKGLRFISQIFDNNEKEPEIEIGLPTDVRHVAHIGWDGRGPTESSPSWMNEFKSVPGISPAPQNLNGDTKGPGNSSKVSADSTGRDSSELPKTSRRHSNSKVNIMESQGKEKSDRPKHSKKSSKHTHSNGSDQGSDLPPMDLSESPKKGRSKKSKDGSSGGGSSKMRSKAQSRDHNSNDESHSRSSSKSRNKSRANEEDEQVERSNMTPIQTNQ